MRLGAFVLAADMPATDRLWATVDAWWEAIEELIVTGVTNARREHPLSGSFTRNRKEPIVQPR